MNTQRRCGLFLPGHNVHYIQALKLDPHAMAVAGSIVIEDGERLWFVADEGSPRVGPFSQHSMPLTDAMVRDSGGRLNYYRS